MRLPWPFRQRTPSDGTSTGAPAEGPAGSSVADSPAQTASTLAAAGATPDVAPPTGAWRSLPPIQRSTGPAPLVASPSEFLADVPGHQGLPSIVPQLGHESSPTAPAGLVVAHARPTPSLTSSTPMPMRPVQRAAAGLTHGEPDAASWSEAPADAGASPVAEPAPVRTLAAVAPAATVAPPARPLTVAPAPAAVAQRSAAGITPSPRQASAASATGAAAPSGPASTLEATGAAPGQVPAPMPLRPGVQRSRWSEAPAPASPPTPGAAASPGLGAPISQDAAAAAPAPATGAAGPAVQRAAATTSPAAAVPGLTGHPGPGGAPAAPRRAGLGAPIDAPLPVAQRSSARAVPAASTPASAPASSAAGPAAASRPLPVLPVARRAAASQAHDHGGGSPVHASASPGVQPSSVLSPGGHAAASGPAIVPLMGARPLRPSIPLQREADTPASSTEVVPTSWVPSADLPETVAAMPPARGGADAVPLQRLAETSGPDAGPAAPVPMREITFPAAGAGMPSEAGASLPGAHDPGAGSGFPGPGTHGASAAMAAPAATAAVAGPTGRTPIQRASQRGPAARTSNASPLTLARSHAPAQAAAQASAHASPGNRITAEAPAPVVQTSSAGATSTTAGTTSQLPTFTATPVVQRVEGAAPEASEKSGHTDTELDELAKAIFGRISNHLRTEVIHEREAKGLTFDAF